MANDDLRSLFRELSSTKSVSRCASLRRDIRLIKTNLVKEKKYVGIIHMMQFLKPWEKDRLLIALINKWPESYLFVLGFANADMYSYKRAYEKAMHEYENNVLAINEDLELLFDEKLHAYLSIHYTAKDIGYVQNLIDNFTRIE